MCRAKIEYGSRTRVSISVTDRLRGNRAGSGRGAGPRPGAEPEPGVSRLSGEAAVPLSRSDDAAPRLGSDEGLEALQEPRRHHGRAVALLRPGHHHVGAAERLHEIVRRLADPPLRRRQADPGAHRSVQKGVGLGPRRPGALVEPPKHHPVDGEKPRLEEPEDLEAAMGGAGRRAQCALARQGGEEGGVVDEAPGGAADARQGEVVEQGRERLDGFIPVRARSLVLAGGESLDSAPMGRRQGDEIELARRPAARARSPRTPRPGAPRTRPRGSNPRR